MTGAPRFLRELTRLRRRWRITLIGALSVVLVSPVFVLAGWVASAKTFDNRCAGATGELVIEWWPPTLRCPLLERIKPGVLLAPGEIAWTAATFSGAVVVVWVILLGLCAPFVGAPTMTSHDPPVSS
jgi:hypothetical protein